MASGYWQYRTTTYVEIIGQLTTTETETISTYLPSVDNAACSDSQNPCGSTCCDSGFYCLRVGQCTLIAGGSSGGVTPLPPSPLSILPNTLSGASLPSISSPVTDISTTSGANLPTAGTNTASPSTSGLSTCAKAGIGVGAVLGAAALFAFAFWLGWILRKRRRSPVDLSHDLPIGETEAKHSTHSM
ncbi:hypothetical protein BKA58DRAFT_169756 [Alternaria rosae]|uniref:uncharacterized protein n=1 Tax=Alternaria rosae TaxID=1187941 RepID=UPI001E8DB980|nr:uncharacterized protein BKA58DRAFT_169756 [Alternaria rosae]KAH6870021.1 hypothetical protein BKA58DRAFT_169756 [Alternaria rosae]